MLSVQRSRLPGSGRSFSRSMCGGVAAGGPPDGMLLGGNCTNRDTTPLVVQMSSARGPGVLALAVGILRAPAPPTPHPMPRAACLLPRRSGRQLPFEISDTHRRVLPLLHAACKMLDGKLAFCRGSRNLHHPKGGTVAHNDPSHVA